MAHGAVQVDERGAPTSFLVRWVYSTNHKDIGTLYLTSAFTAGVIGMLLSILFRAELMTPGAQVLGDEHHFFNMLVTAHGLLMVFFFIMPAIAPGFSLSSLFHTHPPAEKRIERLLAMQAQMDASVRAQV